MNKVIKFFTNLFSKKKFECYEIWRPNIPDNGCSQQCKECREKEMFEMEQKLNIPSHLRWHNKSKQ